MAYDTDLLVIGGGIIGVAVAREAALGGRRVVLAETNAALGMETSSRNSEVIHAGLYYPPGSQKARLCLEGRDRLYRFARKFGVKHRRCGKIIVASEHHQETSLDTIEQRARANGIENVLRLSAREIARKQPALRAVGALFSPDTGIIDSHGFLMTLAAQAEEAGAITALRSTIGRVRAAGVGWAAYLDGEAEPALTSAAVINAGGLAASQIAKSIEGYTSMRRSVREWAKGSYFGYAGKVPFDCLVYPVPEAGGLGIHLTFDMAGRARFGPNVDWVDRIDYGVDPDLKDSFADAISTYWPDLDRERLYPDYSGIRPKIGERDNPAMDFLIEGPADHGLRGVVNLLGIESPGLTAALAIAREAIDALER